MFHCDMFTPKVQSVQTPVTLQMKDSKANVFALVDSGATDNFINARILKRANIDLPIQTLLKSRVVRNVDGTKNKGGQVTQVTKLCVDYAQRKKGLKFFIADLGEDDMILGYPFLAALNPTIDWSKGQIYGDITACAADVTNIRPVKADHTDSKIAKLTISTKLAAQATDQVKKDWKELVPKVYHDFEHLFSEKASHRLPFHQPWDHKIELLPEAPATLDCKIYPLSPDEQKAQDEFLAEHLSKGYIRPSNSPYAAASFFVGKKDGKRRYVQDYRPLNKVTRKNKYPLPLIKELINKFQEPHYFTLFDVRWGYNNIRIKEGDEWKAAFKTNRGLFEPTVMTFGMTNAPATFMSLMNHIFLQELMRGWLTIYMDDGLIATPKKHGLIYHISKVRHCFKKLLQFDLYLKPEKCKFHKEEVTYLGVVIGHGQVKMDPTKVAAIKDWPEPTTVRELRSFLGFGNFYKYFIKNYSKLTRPLHDLTKKGKPWTWQEEHKDVFYILKKMFTSYPVLRQPNPEKQYILETDASAFAIGATLMQEYDDGKHPVGYFSKSLNPAERNYDIYDRELLAIVRALEAFRHLILGAEHKTIVRSDHKNLAYFKHARDVKPRQARWMEFLDQFDFELQHISGQANTVADLLSRRKDLEGEMNYNKGVIVLPQKLFNTPYKDKDPKIRRIYLKEDPQTRRQVLKEVHDSPVGGHPGITNTWELVKRHYEGPRLRQFVEEYVKGCAKCQESKTITNKKKAPLQPFDVHIPEGPFQYVSMDLITDLPKSGKSDTILTIVDQGCSKAAKFIPCTKEIDAAGVAMLYLKHLLPWFGIPKRIISDRDPRFKGNFARTLCKATGIHQNISTAFHPRTDGQTERMNQWIETYLREFTNGRQNDWKAYLPIAEFAHNSWKHEGTKFTPHELLFGFNPKIKLKLTDDTTPTVQERLKELSDARNTAQKTLQEHIDKTIPPKELKQGQSVWLEGRNLSTKLPSKKLAPKRYGPFVIKKKISPVAYQLELPETMKVHDVFHIDLLTPFKETEAYGKAYQRPPPVMDLLLVCLVDGFISTQFTCLACALCSPYALVCAPRDVLHRLHGDSRICTIPDMNDSIVLGLLIVLQTTKTHKEFEVLTGVRMTRDLLSV